MDAISRRNLFSLSFTLFVVMPGYSLAMPLLPIDIENFGVVVTELGWPTSTYSLLPLTCAPVCASFPTSHRPET